jgi:hypothetical protein
MICSPDNGSSNYVPEPIRLPDKQTSATTESVHWNGFHYVSHCKDCGKPILRKPKGGWRLSKSSTTNSIWGTPDQIEETTDPRPTRSRMA